VPRLSLREAFDRLMWIMAKREGIGDILAEGTYRAAKKMVR